MYFITDIENINIESSLRFKDDVDNKPDLVHPEEYKKLLQEIHELTEVVVLQNGQLPDIIIDQIL